MRAAVAQKKKEEEKKTKGEGASSSFLKAIGKVAPKRKANGKDDRPPKKASVTPGDKLPKKSSPPKSSHRAGKGLMMTSGPVGQGPDYRLLTHKDYAVEVMESIIKDKDVDPYAEQATEELGASGLFDLARVHFFLPFSLYSFLCSIADSCFVFVSVGLYEGIAR